MSRRVLIIEDNREIAELVALHLRDEGCEVSAVHDGEAGLREAQSGGYDLVVLDLMLPGLDGLSICRRLREGAHYTPILILTSRDSELDRVLGLELGADDYLTKPFSIRELVARVKALFRRVDALGGNPTAAAEDSAVISAGALRIDPQRREASVEGRALELTAREFDLLYYFATHPGRVFTRAQLLDQVWGYGHEGYEHTVNSHINRLRGKVERDPSHPDYILTVWGVGYKFAGDQ